MVGCTPDEILQLHPLLQAFTMQLASELEADRREFEADMMEALAKSLAGK